MTNVTIENLFLVDYAFTMVVATSKSQAQITNQCLLLAKGRANLTEPETDRWRTLVVELMLDMLRIYSANSTNAACKEYAAEYYDYVRLNRSTAHD